MACSPDHGSMSAMRPKLQVPLCLLCRNIRRKRNATLFFIEAAVQWVNLIFYTVSNAYLLKEPCYFFGRVVFWCGWIRWTCWNTVRASFPSGGCLVHRRAACMPANLIRLCHVYLYWGRSSTASCLFLLSGPARSPKAVAASSPP